MFVEKAFAYLTGISFWLFLLTLPPFQTGIWIDCESVIVGTYFLYALLGTMLLFAPSAVKPNRVTLLFFGFGFVSMFVGLWAENPLFHWIGAPTLGEGTLMFCGLGVLSLSIQRIIHNNHEKTLAYACIVACLVAGTLCFLNHPLHKIMWDADWTPYAFNAFLAQMVVGCFAVMLIIPHAARWIAGLCVLLILISASKTAVIFGFVGLGIIAVAEHTKKTESLYKVSLLLLPVAILVFTMSLDLQTSGLWASLYSRKLNILVYVNEWQNNWGSLFYGHGWGSYYSFLQKYLPALPVSLYEKTNWNPNWDGIDRLDFHCMHQALESLFALGILGLVLFYALIQQAFRTPHHPNVRPLVFLGTWLFVAQTSTWFTMPTLWPFSIFFLNVITQRDQTKTSFMWAVKPLMMITVVGSLWAGWTVLQTALDYEAPQQSLFHKATQRQFLPLAPRAKPYAVEGFHMGYELIALSGNISRASLKSKKRVLKQLDSFFHAHQSSLMMNVGLIHFFSSLKYDYDKLKPSYKQTLDHHWNAINSMIIQKYPERLDFLFDYGTFLLKTGRLKKFRHWLQELKKINPEHCTVLWLEGIYYAQEKRDLKRAVPFLVKAVDRGIDRWIPIPGYLLGVIRSKGKSS